MKHLSQAWTLYEAAHLLNRAGYGGTPSEIEALHQRGREGAVDWLLEAKETEDFPPPKSLEVFRKSQIEVIQWRRNRSAELSPELFEEKKNKLQKIMLKHRRQATANVLGWWVRRLAKSEAPLREKMVMFWHDHFPTSVRKVTRPDWLFRQNELFREHALGNFGKLVHEVSVDPAMLVYLDLHNSHKKKPNENFARELMELFTLGEGHYTEEDIKESARAFTGYVLNHEHSVVEHRERRWDEGAKTVLGETGIFQGSDVVNLMLQQEACSSYLTKKIWEYFCYENPSDEMIQSLAIGFRESGYEVKSLLRKIFLSKEFYSEKAMFTRVKSPVEFVVMLGKQLEVKPLPEKALTQVLAQLGQVPFSPPNVAGWDWGKAWVNTSTLLTRYHLAGVVTGAGGDLSKAAGKKKGAKLFQGAILKEIEIPDYEKLAPSSLRQDVSELVKHLSFRFFQAPLREKERLAFESYGKAKKGVRFTDAEVAELIHLMMSTPIYQLG